MNRSSTKNINEMSTSEVEKLWEENAELWTQLGSKGKDLYRDNIATPGFFSVLPDIKNLRGLDIGCGNGYHTKLLAQKGATVIGVDLSPTFINYANETKDNLPVSYQLSNALNLPFQDGSFDFATFILSLIDIPDYKKALSEAYRVINENGFLQFIITHPCTWVPTNDFKWVKDEQGKKCGAICTNYFNRGTGVISEWMFEGVNLNENSNNKYFRSPVLRRTLTEWIRSLIELGFVIEELFEPFPSDDIINKHPSLNGASLVPIFLTIRCRKHKTQR